MLLQMLQGKLILWTIIIQCLFLLEGGPTLAQGRRSSHSMVGQKPAGLRLRILPERSIFDSRENIRLIVISKNEGTEDLHLSLVAPEYDCDATVMDSMGKLIQLSPEGEKIKNRSIFRREYIVLRPGKAMVEEINLNQLFNLADEGEYRVNIIRDYDINGHFTNKDSRRFQATSNQVVIRLSTERGVPPAQADAPENISRYNQTLKLSIFQVEHSSNPSRDITDSSSGAITIEQIESVRLRIVCKNDSLQEMVIPFVDAAFDYDVVVVDSQGGSAQLSNQGKQVKSRSVFRHEYRILKPGEEITEEIDLKQLFDLSRGGEYDVTSSRFFYTVLDYSTDANNGRTKAISNQVRIRVQY